MNPIDRTHHTSDGPIRVWVYQTERGWFARHQGPQLDGGEVFRTLKAANAYAEESFAQMFPEHECGKRCKSSTPSQESGVLEFDPEARAMDRYEQVASLLKQNRGRAYCANCLADALKPDSRRQKVKPSVNHIRNIAQALANAPGYGSDRRRACDIHHGSGRLVFWAK